MAGVCNLARIWERKKLCHSFGNAVDLLLAVCMLVQEMADMLFHLGLKYYNQLSENSIFYPICLQTFVDLNTSIELTRLAMCHVISIPLHVIQGLIFSDITQSLFGSKSQHSPRTFWKLGDFKL